MSRINRNARKKISQMERGQVLVVVALAAIGIIAIIGLVMDVGLMFIGNARLRRATDAAALAAALQYRLGTRTDLLADSVTDFLKLNGVTLDSSHPVTVQTCAPDSNPELCYDASQGKIIPRKLVYVKTYATVQLAFLPVIGINHVTITAESTSEAASLDLVLAIDTSESMSYDALKPGATGYNPKIPWELRDPSICNDDQKSIAAINADTTISATDKAAIVADIQSDGMPGECHPFEEVKTAAVQFVDSLYYPYDRVSVLTFDKTAINRLQFDQNCTDPSGCTSDQIKVTIENAIKNLKVYEGDTTVSNPVCPSGQPCRLYCTQANIDAGYCDNQPADAANLLQPTDPGAVYAGHFGCGNGWYYDPNNLQDPSGCTTTNIGDGLQVSGDEYAVLPRQGSLWVVILLTDGSANHGTASTGSSICPPSTWDPYRAPNAPLCRDTSSDSRHCSSIETARCLLKGNGVPVPPALPLQDYPTGVYQAGVLDSTNYDADDYARDMADFVGLDQKALVFTIGLGNQVYSPLSDPAGQRLLVYAAESDTDGQFFYAEHGLQLTDIFKKIGDNIETRLER